MSSGPVFNRAFGGAVGAAVGCLTIAAHGLGGGDFPKSASLTLLIALCGAVGMVAANLRRKTPATAVGLLAAGQLAGHGALSGMAGTMHSHRDMMFGTWQMLGAHAIATLLCAVLIAAVARVRTTVAHTHWAGFPAIAPISTVAASAWNADREPLFGAPLCGAISRRGPPCFSA